MCLVNLVESLNRHHIGIETEEVEGLKKEKEALNRHHIGIETCQHMGGDGLIFSLIATILELKRGKTPEVEAYQRRLNRHHIGIETEANAGQL